MEQRDLEGFRGFPQEPGVVWQVDLFLLPLWVKAEEGNDPRLEMVWAAFCLDLSTSEITMSRMSGAPEGSLAVDALPELARRTGRRPERIQVADLEVAEKVRTALASVEAEVDVELRESLRELRSVFEAFREQISRTEDPAEAARYRAALFFYAETLYDAGRYAEAAEPLQELLRLDRYDPGKARYLLADSLLHLRRHDELQDLFGRYRDASAFWTWPRALLAFRREGDSPAARELLDEAIRRNPFVPQALLAPDSGAPATASRLLRTGSEEEARAYAAEGRAVWETTPGALDWLAARTAGERERKKK